MIFKVWQVVIHRRTVNNNFDVQIVVIWTSVNKNLIYYDKIVLNLIWYNLAYVRQIKLNWIENVLNNKEFIHVRRKFCKNIVIIKRI